MGKRGPRPKPTHLSVVEGRKGAKGRAAREPKPKPPTESATRPWGELTAEESKHYKRALRELLPMGHVGEVDLSTLTLWAKAHATALKAYADVRSRGQMIAGVRRGKDEDGQRERVLNRSVQIARDYSALARILAAELGMTPAGRVGMAATHGAKIPGSLGALLGDEPAEGG